MISRLNDLLEEGWGKKRPLPLAQAMTYLTHLALLCPEGATPQSPGLPRRLSPEPKAKEFSTARRLRQCRKL